MSGFELENIEYCRARSRVCPQHHERLAKEILVPGDAVAFVMKKALRIDRGSCS